MSERYPEKDAADRAYDTTRLLLSVFPYGGLATEVLSLLLSPPVMRRRDEWYVQLASVVDEINRRTKNFDIETLHQNEQFISATIEATRIATSTHHAEKRTMLRNILVKIGMTCDIDEDLQFIYLRLVDSLAPIQIKVLEFFWRGNQRLAAINGGSLPMGNQQLEFVERVFPEIRGKGHLVEQMIQDLRSKGLCTAQSITAGMGSQVMTNHGIGFLGFIMSPDEIP